MEFKKGIDRRVREFAPRREEAPSPPTQLHRSEEAPEPAAGPKAAGSVIDAKATFEGHIHAEQDLWVEGSIRGEISCRGKLTIDTHAVVNARIDAQDCVIFGTVDGDITCPGRLRLAPTAVVTTKLRVGFLIVDEGATMTGSVETNYSGEVAAVVARSG